MKFELGKKKKAEEHELKPLLPTSIEKPHWAKILRCPTSLREPAAANPQSEKDSGGTSNPPLPIISSSGDSSQNNSAQRIPPTRSSQSNPQAQQRSRNKGRKWELDELHPRFGHIYAIGERDPQAPSNKILKERAWKHLVKKSTTQNNSPEEVETEIKEIYSTAVSKSEAEEKTTYGVKSGLIGSEFRWMLIQDGCLFLQLALLILGYHDELKYATTHPLYGPNRGERGTQKWIEAMFFAGNQIPSAVLQELMAQKFFKDIVLSQPKRTMNPKSLCEKVLYELFIVPILKKKPPNQWLMQNPLHKEALDVLHALRILLLGSSVSQNHLSGESKRDAGFDLEANNGDFHDNDDDDDDDDDYDDDEMNDGVGDGKSAASRERKNNARAIEERKRTFPCATDLNRRRIYIQNLDNPGIMGRCFKWCRPKSSGIRGIKFQSRYLWAHLYLPSLHMDLNTEHILGNLKIYEKQRLRDQQPEVSSYLRFMSDIVRTKRDVRFLKDKGIIKLADGIEVHRVPGILNRLASEDIGLTPELRSVRRQVRDYSSPWLYYKGLISVVAILTFVQAVFSVVQYFHPRK